MALNFQHMDTIKNKEKLYNDLEALYLKKSYHEVISLWEVNMYKINFIKETSLAELLAVSYIENSEFHIALGLVDSKLEYLKEDIHAIRLNNDLKDDLYMFLLLQVDIYQKLNLNFKALTVLNKYKEFFENKEHFAQQIRYSLDELTYSLSNLYWKIGFSIVAFIIFSIVLKNLGVQSILLNVPYFLLFFYALGYFLRKALYNAILKKLSPN